MNIPQILQKIEQNRAGLTNTLLYFVQTDTILFAFNEECRCNFSPLIKKANAILNSSFSITMDITAPVRNQTQNDKLLSYIKKLSLHQFALLYLVATEIRSVLLAILFIEKNITLDVLLQTAFFEELYQQKFWGKTAETEAKYNSIKIKIAELEQSIHE